MIDVNKIPNTIAKWDATYSDKDSYIRNPENVRVNDIDHFTELKYDTILGDTEFSKRMVKIYHKLFSLEDRILLEKSHNIKYRTIIALMEKVTPADFWNDSNHPLTKKLNQCERNYLTAHGVDCENFEKRIAWLRILEDILYWWCEGQPNPKDYLGAFKEMEESGIICIRHCFGADWLPMDDRPGYLI